ncbi:MAG: DUF3179 domain-containing protein [Proteobacteria bacterium]|nr:DUF3179 domain-containing protein [Pseudomonadota bacterium]
MLRRVCFVLVMVFALLIEARDGPAFFSRVIREDGRTYIVDSRGERWDVTQAESIGFKPEGFQYGLGRNAFTPLDDSYLSENTDGVSRRLRVLGVVNDTEAQAYSIRRLGGHEIANSKIGSQAIAVGY